DGRRITYLPEGLLNPGVSLFQNDLYPQTMVVLDYAKLDEPALDINGNPTGESWRHYLEKAFADTSRERLPFLGQGTPEDYNPISYRRVIGTPDGFNVSL